MTEFILCHFLGDGATTLVNVAEVKYIHRYNDADRWLLLETKDGRFFEYQYDYGNNVQDVKQWFALGGAVNDL